MPRRRPIIAAFAFACAVPLALGSLSACGGPGGGGATSGGATPAADVATVTASSVAVPDSKALITDLGQAGTPAPRPPARRTPSTCPACAAV